MRKAVSVMGLLIVWLVVNPGLWSQDKDRAGLAKAVAQAKVSLDQGLSVSAHAGKPISAKFEIEDGELQLSVYTAKGDTFSEVVVDTDTGKVAWTWGFHRSKSAKGNDVENEAVASHNSRQRTKRQPRIPCGEHLSSNQGWPSDSRSRSRKGRPMEDGV